MIYFPRERNLRPLALAEVQSVHEGVSRVGELPWPVWSPKAVRWYEDSGMTLENGVMGLVRFLDRDKILLSPVVVKGMSWGNPLCIATAIHELTHRHQMSWCGGLLWPLLNLPGLRYWLFAERWAKQNELAAMEFVKS